MSEPRPITKEHMATRSIGFRFVENPEEHTEIWQIVFDNEGGNARLAAVHEYELCRTDKELKRFTNTKYRGIEQLGMTWQSEPYVIGFKSIPEAEKKEYLERLVIENTRENYLLRLKNQYESELYDEEVSGDYEEEVAYIQEMSEEEYQEFAEDNITNITNEIFQVLTEQQAKQKFMEFLMMNSALEKTIKDQDIEENEIIAYQAAAIFKGINYNL